ncbi:hypothetical protein ABZ942_21750 [Nocardia sp. NPDC046473]|uniref:hypothetical protein n=1 Tax=Nocardia sp. NPDC046473 TaxID=3155733 RepID=UPI00340B7139
MTSSRFAVWPTRLLLFGGTFVIVFAVDRVFALLGTPLFGGILEMLLWSLGGTLVALFLVSRGVLRTAENNAAQRAMRLVFSPKRNATEIDTVANADLAVLARMIRQISIFGSLGLLVLAVLCLSYASSIEQRAAWVAFAGLCIVSALMLWVVRFAGLRRIRRTRTAFFGTSGKG